jgi:GlcNAc-P-P-Und epimerase
VHRDDIRETALYYEVNVGGMRNLLAACEDASVRKIVFTGTVACYGLDAENPNEDAPTAPFNDYGRSKLEAEDLLRDWAGRTGGHAIIVRPCVVFGEGNRGNVYTLLRQIHQRRFPMVGDGANRKSMAYVANVAEFLAWLAENVDGTQVFNYADKPDLTTREIVHIARTSMGLAGMPLKVPYGLALSLGRACDMVAALTHTTLPFSRIRVVKFCANTMVDAAKAHASGFRARHSLEQALRHTIQHEFGSRSSSSAMP